MRTDMQAQTYLTLLVGYYGLNILYVLWLMVRNRKVTLTRSQMALSLIAQGLLVWGAVTCLK